ncbi:MAG: Gfo/Idh/MocA family oxidoreductase [Planctomycetota bacterium]
MNPLDVTIVGGGMITQVQILPSIYQLQREGIVGDISICALNGRPLKALADTQMLKESYPGQSFIPYPDYKTVDLDKPHPELFKQVLSKMKPRQIVAIALPDQLHYAAVKEALAADQHILCVKPLVLKYKESIEIEEIAHQKGLVVGIEYHKRFDDRALIARKRYRAGLFGQLKVGQARLMEPWYYRHSNFQNWCTVENSDPFTYVGCHYVDLVAFITGLMPVEVSVRGLIDAWPNGKKAYLWSDGRVVWENGAILNVQNGFGYPDEGPGGNSQGMLLFMDNHKMGALIDHRDDFRGVAHSVVEKGTDPGDTYYMHTSPDYFQMVPYGGPGYRPVGYGHRSVEAIIKAAVRCETQCAGQSDKAALATRQALLKEIDDAGIVATPKNSAYNELVMEAGRLSITSDGRPVVINYGKTPGIAFK